jgi:hypothetical protein
MKNGRSGLSEGIPLNIKRQKIDDEWVIRQWISDLDLFLDNPEPTDDDRELDLKILYMVLDNCVRK